MIRFTTAWTYMPLIIECFEDMTLSTLTQDLIAKYLHGICHFCGFAGNQVVPSGEFIYITLFDPLTSPSDPENFPFVVLGGKADVDGGNSCVDGPLTAA
ncbi:hypothetical protein FRX31_028838 [Thalictrum thalictroides]|uniref:Uncharacterized protein n=1 Tax=Thalictrum thalictroides TaxID=46969 RepID=A0A7J6VBM6_THATH|nr:hypothetical protein FRX31_028838 [Thalictrum thalictroides]